MTVMCVSVYKCICTCHIQTHVHTHMYTHPHVRTRTHQRTCKYIVDVYMLVSMSVCVCEGGGGDI